eukprot:2233562-Lingulodinium_polyedra.AAC.1
MSALVVVALAAALRLPGLPLLLGLRILLLAPEAPLLEHGRLGLLLVRNVPRELRRADAARLVEIVLEVSVEPREVWRPWISPARGLEHEGPAAQVLDARQAHELHLVVGLEEPQRGEEAPAREGH